MTGAVQPELLQPSSCPCDSYLLFQFCSGRNGDVLMLHKRFAVTKEWKPLQDEEPLVLVPSMFQLESLPLKTLVDAEPMPPCRSDDKAVTRRFVTRRAQCLLCLVGRHEATNLGCWRLFRRCDLNRRLHAVLGICFCFHRRALETNIRCRNSPRKIACMCCIANNYNFASISPRKPFDHHHRSIAATPEARGWT